MTKTRDQAIEEAKHRSLALGSCYVYQTLNGWRSNPFRIEQPFGEVLYFEYGEQVIDAGKKPPSWRGGSHDCQSNPEKPPEPDFAALADSLGLKNRPSLRPRSKIIEALRQMFQHGRATVHCDVDDAIDAFKAKMQWGPTATDDEKTLVLGNLAGFVAHLKVFLATRSPDLNEADYTANGLLAQYPDLCLERTAGLLLKKFAAGQRAAPQQGGETTRAERELAKLVRFFNEPAGYSRFGFYGDEHGLSEADSAVRGLRDCIAAEKRIAALEAALREIRDCNGTGKAPPPEE